MRHILVPIHAKPRTCGNCKWWRYFYDEPWCRVFRRRLRKEWAHVYRCEECLRADRKAE